jgi:hypothetical protein
MRTYYKTFRCSEDFPAIRDEEFSVRDGNGKAVEHWQITQRSRKQFTVRITEFVPE